MDLVDLSGRLLYSSHLVRQTYERMFGSDVPAGAPERYRELAVLHERLAGVATTLLPDPSEIEADRATPGEDESGIPVVWTTTGELTISNDADSSIADGELFVSRLSVGDRVLEAAGSAENYHPLVRAHVERAGEFAAGRVFATIHRIDPSDDGRGTHFCQLARCVSNPSE